MKNPLINLLQPFKKSPYYREILDISTVLILVLLSYLCYAYGKNLLEFADTEAGAFWILAFFSGVVLALTVKLFYRTLIIKYDENDSFHQRLNKK